MFSSLNRATEQPIILTMTKGYISRLFKSVAMAVLLFPLYAGCSSSGTKIDFRLKKEDVISLGKSYTRTSKIYRDLDTVLVGDVLWYSSDLRRGYLDEMKSKKRLDDQEYEEEIKHIQVKDEREIDFIAGFYTPERKWDDFANRSSIWSIRLVGRDGKLVEPRRIVKLKLRNIPDAHLFPFISDWKSIYRITFNRDDDIAGLEVYRLRVYSIVGETAFEWETSDAERQKPPYQRSVTERSNETEVESENVANDPVKKNKKVDLGGKKKIIEPLDIGIKPSIIKK